MNFGEYVLMMLLGLNLVVVGFQALAYMVSNLGENRKSVSRLKVMENKLYPHKLFYTSMSLLILIIANAFLHQGLVRSLVFVPFLLLVHSIGSVFQEQFNADTIK